MSKTSDKPYFIVSSLERGLRVIELLAEKKALSVTEVAKLLDLNRSAAHRFLATLRESGYVVQDEHSRYRLSLKLFEMGNKIANITEIRSIVRPYMRELSNRHRETVNLGRMDGEDMVIIDVVLGTEAIRFDSHIGERSPAHTLAMGKAILAFHPEPYQKAYIEKADFKALTPQTIINPAMFEKTLQEVGKKGYAVDDEEWTAGLRCVSAPIFNHAPYPSFAISISGPTLRMTSENMEIIQQDLKTVCREISQRLGGNPGT